ncbi:tetratricopeptide repeat protein [Streptomyces clavifer]|uniref:tetratricopeptide repeat protein n=1 Tax=Streptomyces clavifer TaxID=68188 RepID=UPI003089E333|nr:tetratricopeptide repeat protein [Streptomyces clavifer]WRY80070.1 tetratricopeptide repeat protein [Streptomyces clavifer]WRY86249.1 tetratricopeptide repeat protein [Streptomyces clavifer]WRY86264.1 tetratricopeptide repeat protein [Streptomyces clavifer]
MGGKSSAKRKGKKSGKAQKQGQGRPGGAVRNDYRGAEFTNSQVVSNGSMTASTYVQQYAPVPTALDALPALPQEFTGRADDLAFILGVLDPDRPGDGPAVAVLSGWGGVGKTTLAYAAGHAAQQRDWFTGVLLVDLRGYDPHPAQAEDALEALLRSLGVRPEHLPPPGAGREVLYRSQLNARQEAGERLLVVADNASALAQVQPLLPPGHHGMLVTSRHGLAGLGRMRTVNRLQPDDAITLLEAALKKNDPDDVRVEEDPGAAERVVLACGCLPLALQITAALLAQDPEQPLSERAEALSQTEGVLDGLSDGERSLRAMFDQSLDRLQPQERDLFRLLSLNPGPDIATLAVAVLVGQPQPATERLLGRLAAGHLIERNPAARGRWQMHDLLRAYANEQAETVKARGRDPRRRYDQARTRLINHYTEHAKAADTHFHPPGSAVSPRFPDREQALVWFDAERENLIATAHTSPQAGLNLGFALGRYLEWRRRFQDLVVVRSLALDACRTLHDTRNEAHAWNNLGSALKDLRRFDEALHAHETARTLHQQTGNTHGQATAWNNLGNALKELRRFDEALHAHETARNLHQQTGNTHGQATAWNNLGNALKELRRFDEALHAHETARNLYQQTGNTHNQAGAWNNLGLTLQELRRFDEALHAHETTRNLFQQTGDTHGQAGAWDNLGNALKELRRFDEALHAHETARNLFQQTGDTHGQAMTWNNLGTAYRGLGRFEEAVAASRRAVAMLVAAEDWFRAGEGWGELAATLAAAGADPGQVRDAWNESAAAYARAGADEEAAASRAHTDGMKIPEEQLPVGDFSPFEESSEGTGTGAGA